MTTRKLYIRTFGCQMNEYDSDKMSDVLNASHGLTPTDDPADADVILFNTCSVREKAQEKVFSDLGRVKHLKRERPDLVIGVGGCVASQEGAAIVERAPYVDIVFGPQTLHRLAAAHRSAPAHRAGRRSISRFPRSRSSIICRRRGRGRRPPLSRSWKVAASTAASASCRIRAERKSPGPFDDVLTEVADLADHGVKEVTLLGQNVNAYRGVMGEAGEMADFALLLEYIAEIPGIERIRYTTSHPKEFTQRLIDVYARVPKLVKSPAPAGAIRQRPRAGRDEARLHGAGVQVDHPPAATGAAGHFAVVGLHRRISGRDRRGFRRTMRLVEDIGFDASFSFVYSKRPGTPAADLADDTPPTLNWPACSAAGALNANVARISERHGRNDPAQSWSRVRRGAMARS